MGREASQMIVFKRAPLMRRLTPRTRRGLLLGLLFISPWLIRLVCLTAYPLLASLYYSFTSYDIIRAPRWVGLENYVGLMRDSVFRQTVYNTLYYMVFGVPAQVLTGFFLAVLLNRGIRFRSLFRTIFFMPSIIPQVSAAVLWLWLLQPQFGPFNYLLIKLGLPSQPWLSSLTLVKPTLIMISLWGSGQVMVIFLAALQDVPQHLYDAAKIDGANWWQELRHVTIPIVTPAILFTLLTGSIHAFEYFTYPYVMTRGGPAYASTFYPHYLYENAFHWFKMGYSSAMAWVMFVVVVVFALLLFGSSARWVYYAHEG